MAAIIRDASGRLAEEFDLPWYVVDRERCAIRVYHGDLDTSWWGRATTRGERDARRIEGIIRDATGLRRVMRRHDRNIVEFRVRKDLFDRAAVAVRMSIKCLTDNDKALRAKIARREP